MKNRVHHIEERKTKTNVEVVWYWLKTALNTVTLEPISQLAFKRQ